MTKPIKPIEKRYDFTLLFDVKDGNPNGDPDAGGMPRIDAQTGNGLITDVCLKRKVRNYVAMRHSYNPPNDIYVKEKAVLNEIHDRAYSELKLSSSKNGKSKEEGDKIKQARQWMCENFYDIRTFGAMMNTGQKCGQVRGPVQITFARSVAPVISFEHTITRMAVTTKKKAEEQGGDNRAIGRKYTIPYGLYRAHGFISAHLAEQTGFNDNDLELLWEALKNMFEHDRSAARGEMTMRGLYVFKHKDKLGNAPANELFSCIKTELKDATQPARSFQDFSVNIEEPPKKGGVTLERQLG